LQKRPSPSFAGASRSKPDGQTIAGIFSGLFQGLKPNVEAHEASPILKGPSQDGTPGGVTMALKTGKTIAALKSRNDLA
jgi:hypothetical protein